jgi:hypothetical protein
MRPSVMGLRGLGRAVVFVDFAGQGALRFRGRQNSIVELALIRKSVNPNDLRRQPQGRRNDGCERANMPRTGERGKHL